LQIRRPPTAHSALLPVSSLAALLLLACATSSDSDAAGDDQKSSDDKVEVDAGPPVYDAGSASDNAVSAGALCARLATIQCAGEHFCCADPGRDREACENEQRTGCVQEGFLDFISQDPITGFDAEAAEAFFTELSRLASECDSSVASFGFSVDGLGSLFNGTRAEGASCRPALAGSGSTSERGAAALVSCADSENFACLPTSIATWTCSARNGEGGPCFSDANCTDGLYCPNTGSNNFTGDVCKLRKAEGQACARPTECESFFCKDGECVAASTDAAYCLAQ